jgi:hypothetical protein
MKRYCMALCFAALTASSVWAHQDNGRDLKTTIKFIKEKLEAKAESLWRNLTIEADPARCELTDTRFQWGTSESEKDLFFRRSREN